LTLRAVSVSNFANIFLTKLFLALAIGALLVIGGLHVFIVQLIIMVVLLVIAIGGFKKKSNTDPFTPKAAYKTLSCH